jgi:hypothetical protein
MVAEAPFGDNTGVVQIVAKLDPNSAGGLIGLGTVRTLSGSYKFYQDLLERPPGVTDYWTDGDIEKALWGLSSGAGKSRVTMLWIEKLVSLRNVPYQCGQISSYVA